MSSSLVSLLWWIAIGALFFWLMSRGGCGMGHRHGHDREHRGGAGTANAGGTPGPGDEPRQHHHMGC